MLADTSPEYATDPVRESVIAKHCRLYSSEAVELPGTHNSAEAEIHWEVRISQAVPQAHETNFSRAVVAEAHVLHWESERSFCDRGFVAIAIHYWAGRTVHVASSWADLAMLDPVDASCLQ